MISFQKVLQWKGFPVGEAKGQLEFFSSLNSSERKNWIQQKKDEIVRHHGSHNEHYRKLAGKELPASWHDLPILYKKNFQAPIKEMLSDTVSIENVYISNTSGSSGHPFFFAKDKFSHALTWAFIMESYQKLGISQRDKQARFYGIPLDHLSYTKEKLKDYVMNRIRFPVFDMGDAMMEKFLMRFKKNRIRYIYGYTNAILLFAKYVMTRNLVLRDVCKSLHLCIVTSEVCTAEDKALLQTAFGVPVIREYGASEVDVIALEDVAGRWAVNEANLYIEVLADDNTPVSVGTEGRIVITSLHNKAMPFIRYDIGDIGTMERDEKGLIVKKLSGRVNDTIKLPSGKKFPGLTFYYVSRSILESSGVLKEFIIRQTTLDSFEFDVVSDRPLTAAEVADIKSKMDVYLEPNLKLKINRVDKIQRPASGKIKHFYSSLPA